MRNLKRVLSLALASVMLLGMMVIGAGAADKTAADLTDMDKVTNTEAVNLMVDLGIIEGKPDGSFAPTEGVDRATMAKLITYIMMGDVDAAIFEGTVTDLTDIDTNWAEGYIKYCYSNGIISGDGQGHFFPTQGVTVVQAAKMLLVALGYDADNRGYQSNSNWSVNIMKDAQTTGLMDGISATATDSLTRDGAAQMIFNALFANTVEPQYQYDMGTQYIVSYKSAASLAETMYNGLTKVTGVVTTSGANTVIAEATPASVNGVNMDGTKTGLASTPAQTNMKVVFYVDKNGKLVSSAAVSKAATVYEIPVGLTDGAATKSGTVQNWLKGEGLSYTTETLKSTPSVVTYSDAAPKTTANTALKAVITGLKAGEVATAVADGNGKITNITVISKRIANVNDAAKTRVDDETTYVYGLPGITGTGTSAKFNGIAATTETVVGYESLSKGDVVAYYTDGEKLYYENLETVVGQLTSAASNGGLTISGTRYYVSGLTGAMKLDDVKKVGYNKDVTYWLDPNGYIVKAEAVSEETTTQYAIVLNYKKISSTWDAASYQAKLLFTDGTTQIVNVSGVAEKIGGTYADPADGSFTDGTATFVTYTTDKNGDYQLAKVTEEKIGNVTYKLPTLTDATITSGVAQFSGNNIGNAKTIFIVADKKLEKFTVTTGIANAPAYKGGSDGVGAEGMILAENGIASIVYITAGDSVSSTSKANYVYVDASSYDYYPAVTGETDAYKEFKAIVDGEETTVKVKPDSAADASISKSGLYNLTYTDGLVTEANTDGITAGVDNMDGVVKAGSKVWTVNDDTVVYVIEDGAATQIAASDIEDDSNDQVAVVAVGESTAAASTAKTIYIVKVADEG